MAFSPTRKWVASTAEDRSGKDCGGVVQVGDVDTGKQVTVFKGEKGHAGPVTRAAFSPDGKQLASASRDQTVILSDLQACRKTFIFKNYTTLVTSLAFTRDGNRLAFGCDPFARDEDQTFEPSTVQVWDTVLKQMVLSFKNLESVSDVEEEPGPVVLIKPSRMPVAFSPDGKRLACGHSDHVEVWEAEDPTAIVARQRLWQHRKRIAWHLQMAADAEKAGRWFTALWHLDRLLDARPGDRVLRVRRAAVLVHLGEWQKAIANCTEVIRLSLLRREAESRVKGKARK